MFIRSGIITFIAIAICACQSPTHQSIDVSSEAKAAAANIVEAVNNKDAAQYARDLHPEVVVRMFDGEVRLRGRDAVIENRTSHFETHPAARNELVHLVEIDNQVVMHDIVWLDGNIDSEGSDIVEVFTFKNGQIIIIDVIQPANLFAASRSR